MSYQVTTGEANGGGWLSGDLGILREISTQKARKIQV